MPAGIVKVSVGGSDLSQEQTKETSAGVPDRQELLAQVTLQLATSQLDPDEILGAVTTTLSRLRPGTWVATLMNRDPSTSRVVVVNDADPRIAEYTDRYVSALLQQPGQAPTTGIAQSIIASGEPILREQIAKPELFTMLTPTSIDFIESHEAPSNLLSGPLGFLIVPLRSRGARIGVLGFFTQGGVEPPGVDDVPWLQEIADRTGIVVDNAQLRASTADRVDRLAALQTALAALGASRDLRRSLQSILDQLLRGLRVDAADVLVVDESAGSLQVTANAGFCRR
jgi:GAF domain-containing protein